MRNLTLAALLAAVATPALAVDTVQSTDANALAASLAGSGVVATGATLTSNTQNGFFTNGAAATGISQGVVLTTGVLSCIGSANTSASCGGAGNAANLSFSFVATSNNLFFNYVFGSEEYNEFVGTGFNDSFALTLTGTNYAGGVNLAQLPGGGGPVTINNVNSTTNSAYYRNNSGTGSLNLPIELDGLTTVLTASANNLVVGSTYSLSFSIQDVGDSNYDSAVFIQAGSVGTVTPPPAAGVPEPATWATMMLGFGLLGGALRRRRGAAAIA